MPLYTLGRHVKHDERSKDYRARTVALATVQHRHHGTVLNQGRLGSCTANALIQALSCDPLHSKGKRWTEADARQLYGVETRMEGEPWPPNDPGGSGIMVCKAAVSLGLISAYHHAFGLEHCLGALGLQPLIIGIEWRTSMFTPRADGFLDCSGSVAGGHEVCLVGMDVDQRSVTVLNSWGRSWGRHGTALLAWDDLRSLLAQQGDVTVPVR